MTVGSGVNIFRKMDDGRMLQVAWRPNLALAKELIRTLAQMWPAEYLIQAAEPNGESSFRPGQNP